MEFFRDTKIDFMKYRRYFVIVSAAMLLISVLAVFVVGELNLGVDFAGGTRIAESLHAFRRLWGPQLLRRGAVVLVISDGCETGDVGQLKREVQALQRSCYRLVWLNPRLGQKRYEPKVRGMAAVLPYVDDFMPIHSLESLRQLRDHLSRLPRRKGGSIEISR